MPGILSTSALVWAAIAVCLAIAEMILPSFAFVFAAGASVIAALAAACGMEWPGQMIVFTVATLVGIALLRPRMVKRIGLDAKGVPSRTDTLQGKTGRVTEAVDTTRGGGRVEVEGQDWAARCAENLPLGATIVVESADGIVLNVRRG